MSEVYDALIKLPIGKKDCQVVIDRKGDGTFEGTFSVLGSTAPITEGKIDDEGNYSGACKITTILGTMESTTEGKIIDGKIDGCAKNRLGVMPIKSKELW